MCPLTLAKWDLNNRYMYQNVTVNDERTIVTHKKRRNIALLRRPCRENCNERFLLCFSRLSFSSSCDLLPLFKPFLSIYIPLLPLPPASANVFSLHTHLHTLQTRRKQVSSCRPAVNATTRYDICASGSFGGKKARIRR